MTPEPPSTAFRITERQAQNVRLSGLALVFLKLGTAQFFFLCCERASTRFGSWLVQGLRDSGTEPEKAKRLAGQSASLSGSGSAIAVKLDAVAQSGHRSWRSPGIAPGSSPFPTTIRSFTTRLGEDFKPFQSRRVVDRTFLGSGLRRWVERTSSP